MTKIKYKRFMEAHFDANNWEELALIFENGGDYISSHSRLLRSLHFGDDDYGACVGDVLGKVLRFPENQGLLDQYISDYFGETAMKPEITIKPNFGIPSDQAMDESLVSVMMPFSGFDTVYSSIKHSCKEANLTCKRADEVWETPTFMQDIFNLIYRSRIVVCDLSGKNPNVMFELGIAFTLGKDVVMIAQDVSDIPSDIKNYRGLIYNTSPDGLKAMSEELEKRLRTIISKV